MQFGVGRHKVSGDTEEFYVFGAMNSADIYKLGDWQIELNPQFDTIMQWDAPEFFIDSYSMLRTTNY